MNVLVVLAHPRRESLTGAVADTFAAGLAEAGHRSELADLHAEGFDPCMTPADEPDWDDGDKRYSVAVLAEQERIARNDAVALVFPVWWWSVPALLKGWIDRVWNNGWAYGKRNLAGKKGVLIGVAAGSVESYARRRYDEAVRIQLDVGVLEFCGLESGGTHILFGSLDDDATRAALIRQAGDLGRGFAGLFGEASVAARLELQRPSARQASASPPSANARASAGGNSENCSTPTTR
ncbi:MAG: NAD(P)H oxidoreductase [Alphaproteobacteria bacterium]